MSNEVIEFFDRAYRKYPRYWQRDNLHSIDPSDFQSPWREFLEAIRKRPPGLALDLGAGEGSDAIRLARLGFEVDAVEGSAAGAEKIEVFARQAGVRVNVVNADVRLFQPSRMYDVVICNGVLHYLEDEDKASVLRTIQDATNPEGYNLVFLFSDHSPVPEYHKVIDVHCDSEDGIVSSFYRDWRHSFHVEHDKLDSAHVDFPPHRHSYIKVLAKK